VERGLDPRRFALVAFGGAGGMHACALADDLAIDTVLVPRGAGVLSAYGLAAADQRRDLVAPIRIRLADGGSAALLGEGFDRLEAEARTLLDGASIERQADVRYVGQSFELTVAVRGPSAADELADAFHALHDLRLGYRMDTEPVEVMALRVVATRAVDCPLPDEPPAEPVVAPAPQPTRRVRLAGAWAEVPIVDRNRLGAGSTVDGPSIVEFDETTVVVPDAWHGTIDPFGTLVLTR
jgi:N-methylhydantoinase A